MSKKLVTICGMALGAAVLFASSNGYAFTSDGAGGPTAKEEPAQEPSSPSGTGGYDFSNPNFSVSVRRNDAVQNNAGTPQGGVAQPPARARTRESAGFLDWIWNDLLNLVGGGD